MKIMSLLLMSLFALPVFAEGPAAGNGGFSQLLIVMGLMFVFFYFILYRPEKKRRKRMQEQRAAMKKGDKVTAMGIVGTLDSVKDATVILKMVDGAKVEFLKGAITDVQSQEQEAAAEPQKN